MFLIAHSFLYRPSTTVYLSYQYTPLLHAEKYSLNDILSLSTGMESSWGLWRLQLSIVGNLLWVSKKLFFLSWDHSCPGGFCGVCRRLKLSSLWPHQVRVILLMRNLNLLARIPIVHSTTKPVGVCSWRMIFFSVHEEVMPGPTSRQHPKNQHQGWLPVVTPRTSQLKSLFDPNLQFLFSAHGWLVVSFAFGFALTTILLRLFVGSPKLSHGRNFTEKLETLQCCYFLIPHVFGVSWRKMKFPENSMQQ